MNILYAAYNNWGDLICDGHTYDEVYFRAVECGFHSDEFRIVKVHA